MIALVLPAFAQHSIIQGGPWGEGRVPIYSGPPQSQPIASDSGPAGGSGPGVGEMAIIARGPAQSGPPFAGLGSGPYGTNFCDYDGPTTSAVGYHFLCFSANAQGGGLMAYGAAGGASVDPMQFIINGVTFQFPLNFSLNGYLIANGLNNPLTALAPVNSSVAGWNGSGVPTAFANSTTVNGVNCQLGGTCAVTATASSITPGSTTVVGGTNGDIEYNNAGTLGEKGTTGTGNVVQATSPTVSDLTVTGSLTATSLITASDLAVGAATIANGGLYGATPQYGIPYAGGAGANAGLLPPVTGNGALWTASGIEAAPLAPHVATNSGLTGSATTAYPLGVWRDDYALGNGAPPLFYLPSASPCSLNSGNGDNGSQIKSSDGKCWIWQQPTIVDIRDFGAIANGLSGSPTDNTTAICNAIAAAQKVYGPGGVYQFTSCTLTAPSYPTIFSETVEGDADGSTIFRSTATSGAVFSFSIGANPNASFNFRNITLETNQAGTVNGIALSGALVGTGPQVLSSFSHVSMYGASGQNNGEFFGNAIVLSGINLVYFDHLNIAGGASGFETGGFCTSASCGTGILVQDASGSSACCVYQISDSNFTYLGYGIHLNGTLGQGVQGVVVRGSNFVGGYAGILYDGTYPGLELCVCGGNQFNVYFQGIGAGTAVNDIQIKDNFFLLLQPSPVVQQAINLGNNNGGVIGGNVVGCGTSDANANAIIIGNNISSSPFTPMIISGNDIHGCGGNAIWLQSGSKSVNVQANAYAGNGTNVTNSGTGNTVGGGSQ